MQSNKDINDLRNEMLENDLCIPVKKQKVSSPFEAMNKDLLMLAIKKMAPKEFVKMYKTCKTVMSSIEKNSKMFCPVENKHLILYSGEKEDSQLKSSVLHIGSKFHHVSMSSIRFFTFPSIFVSIIKGRNEEEAVSVLQKMNTRSSKIYLCVDHPQNFFNVINLNNVVFFGMTQSLADALKEKNLNQVIVYLSGNHKLESNAFKSLGEKVKIAESPRSFWCSELNSDPTYICGEDDTFKFLLDMDNVENILNKRITFFIEFHLFIQKSMGVFHETYPITELTIPKRLFDRFANIIPTQWKHLSENKVSAIPLLLTDLFTFALFVEKDEELCQQSVLLRFGAKWKEEVLHLIPEKDREELSKKLDSSLMMNYFYEFAYLE